MAVSPLEEFLSNLRAGGQGFAQGGQALEQAAQLEGRDALMAQLQSGQEIGQEQLAGMALQAGDSSLVRELMSGKMKAAQTAQAPVLGAKQLQTLYGISPEQAEIAAGLGNVDDQRQAATAAANQANAAAERNIKLQDLNRREKQPERQQRQKFSDAFGKIEKAVVDEGKQLRNVREALKKGTTSADAIVFNFLARNLAGEKGPLSDSDVNRFISRAFAGDVQKFQNFVSGKSSSTLTGAQRQAYKDLVEQAGASYEAYKDTVIGNALANSLIDYDTLVFDDDVDDAIKERAKRYGYKLNKNEDGTFAFVKAGEQKRQRVSDADLSQAKIPDWVNQLKDESIKKQLLEGIQSGKPLNPKAEEYYKSKGLL